jgi:transglutaminase-like putative cysteine protease
MPEDIILNAFTEWTAHLDAKEARVAVYNHIRDISYAIVSELRDPATGPAGMLKLGKGSCIPKHFLLGMLFEKLNIPVKYATYLFSWDDPRVKYPPDLRRTVKLLPKGTHLACQAYIEGQWILIDATWDSALKRAGFPVNESWDGIRPAKNAVSPIKEIIHDTLEDRVKYAAEHRKSWTDAEVQAYEGFPVIFNAWLDTCRKAAGRSNKNNR